MSQGSPLRMKIAGLFSGESSMSFALTTTHENIYFQRSIRVIVGHCETLASVSQVAITFHYRHQLGAFERGSW
jgi:hypothetical protein